MRRPASLRRRRRIAGRLRRDRSVAVGIAGVIAVLAISYLAFTKRAPIVHGYRLHAVFSSSNELRKNSPVRIAGVDVGRVVGFSPGPGGTRAVELEIGDDGRPVHADAGARIRPRLFLEGSFYVELSPGSPSAPELPDGGTIPLGRTAVPVQLNQILDAFNRPSRESFQHVLDELDVALAKGGAEALAHLGRPLAPALRDVALAAAATRGSAPHDLSDTVRSSSKLTAAVARHREHLAGIVTHLNRTAGALAAEDRRLAAGVRELDGVLQEAPDALTALDGALPSLERFTRAVRPGLRVAPPALAGTTAVLAQLQALVRPKELPRLLARLRPTVLELPDFERGLRVLFGLVTPVTDCVRDRALPVLTSTVHDGRLSTGRPVWQDFVHGLVGVASAAQSFDRNGYYLRLSGLAGQEMVSLGPAAGVGRLLGGAAEPVLGVRPRWLGPGVQPPFRPDQECRRQVPPDLTAGGGAPRAARRGPARAAAPRRSRDEIMRLLRNPPLRRLKGSDPVRRSRSGGLTP